MGWWNTILNVFKVVPKAGDTAMGLIDGAKNGIDKLIFTEEEKAVMGMKAMELWIEVQKAVNQENPVRSITRRYIAVAITVAFLGCLIGSVAFNAFNLLGAAGACMDGMERMANPFMLIMTFYFGTQLFAQVKGK